MLRRFTWDAMKAVQNAKKHRITFESAARVFADSFALSEQDRVEGGEHRWQTIGLVDSATVLLVAHVTYDDIDGAEVIHVVSARRAGRAERIRDEEQRYRQLRT